MPRKNPEPSSEQHQERPPGRFRSAWRVLRGQALTPDQIRWEWVEYQHRFNQLLDKFSAALARDAKRLDRELQSAPSSSQASLPPSDLPGRKSVLRSRFAQSRGLRPLTASPSPSALQQPPQAAEEEGAA